MEKLLVAASAAVLLTFGTSQSPVPPPFPPPPGKWVALAADTIMITPGRPDTPGRYVQDEHGCNRHEWIDPDGSPQIAINNYEQGRVYALFRGTWTARVIRGMEGGAPLPATPRLLGKLDPIDGFEVYEREITVRSPKGESKQTEAVAPALNSLVVRRSMPGGRTERTIAIRTGPQAAEEFVPPRTATVVERLDAYAGGFATALDVQITFVGQDTPLQLTLSEGRLSAVKGPDRDLAVAAMLVEGKSDVVRVRVLANARQAGPMNVIGEELDAIEVPLGGVASTTKLGINLTVKVTRIGTRVAR
jgi:hypothetical protein